MYLNILYSFPCARSIIYKKILLCLLSALSVIAVQTFAYGARLMYYILMTYYIVGAGEFAKEKFCPDKDDVVIAADAGILYTGNRADFAIGDWDSLHGCPKDVETLTLPVMKDYTDTGEAVDYALKNGAREIVLFGAGGGRLDHSLANLQYLAWLAERKVEASMVCPDCTIYAMAQGGRDFFCTGKTLSVIPMRDNVTVSISGVRYPLDKRVLPKDNPGLGVSNVVTEECAHIIVHEGVVLVIVNDKLCDI